MSCDLDSLYESEIVSAAEGLEAEAAEAEEAELCRTQSSSEDETEPQQGPKKIPKLTSWWAQLLQKVMNSCGYDLSSCIAKTREFTIVSGCTGCSAEAAVCKALQGPNQKSSYLKHFLTMQFICTTTALYAVITAFVLISP